MSWFLKYCFCSRHLSPLPLSLHPEDWKHMGENSVAGGSRWMTLHMPWVKSLEWQLSEWIIYSAYFALWVMLEHLHVSWQEKSSQLCWLIRRACKQEHKTAKLSPAGWRHTPLIWNSEETKHREPCSEFINLWSVNGWKRFFFFFMTLAISSVFLPHMHFLECTSLFQENRS